MADDQNKGHDDQELLLRALVKYICTQINRSEQIIWGLMRQSINEWSEKNNSTLKAVRDLPESERLRIVKELIDIFMEKVKHIMDSKFQRDKLKTSIIQIYTQWKGTKRQPNE